MGELDPLAVIDELLAGIAVVPAETAAEFAKIEAAGCERRRRLHESWRARLTALSTRGLVKELADIACSTNTSPSQLEKLFAAHDAFARDWAGE